MTVDILAVAALVVALVYFGWIIRASILASRAYGKHLKALNGVTIEVEKCLRDFKEVRSGHNYSNK